MRLHAAFGAQPRPGALANLLRLKGIAWHGDTPNQQVEMALAGTQFTITAGPLWWAADPQNTWPDGLAQQFRDGYAIPGLYDTGGKGYPVWDQLYGDRRTELVCIGRELDIAAASAQLEACLLTVEEMMDAGVIRVMDEQTRVQAQEVLSKEFLRQQQRQQQILLQEQMQQQRLTQMHNQARTPQVVRQHWEQRVMAAAASSKAPTQAPPSAEQEARAQAAGEALLAELEAEQAQGAQGQTKAAAKEKSKHSKRKK